MAASLQPRTAFATAQIIPFPETAIRWVRPVSDQVALIDAKGRVARFASEPQLHAEVLDIYAAADLQAEAEARAAEREAQAAARVRALVRTHIAQLRAAGWIAVFAVCAWGSFEIMMHSLRILEELAR